MTAKAPAPGPGPSVLQLMHQRLTAMEERLTALEAASADRDKRVLTIPSDHPGEVTTESAELAEFAAEMADKLAELRDLFEHVNGMQLSHRGALDRHGEQIVELVTNLNQSAEQNGKAWMLLGEHLTVHTGPLGMSSSTCWLCRPVVRERTPR